jgi:pimeloyl-ACP methyl ester carboxylesterase
MVGVRHKLRQVIAALLLLTAAGCAGGMTIDPQVTAKAGSPPPGFSADTFRREGLISGATATEAGCRALADGLWVSADNGRHECLRYTAAGTRRGPAHTALVYIPGDATGVAYRFAGGRPLVEGAGESYEVSPETRRTAAEVLSSTMGGRPVILLGRPGMHGSSGDHAQDRHTWAEIELVDAALTELRQRYGFQDFVLSGFSSGGAITANLLARRSDVRCAVIASAPLDLAAFYQGQDGTVLSYYTMHNKEFADPMRTVRSIRSDASIIVLGDQRDRKVPASAWHAWATAARSAGLRVFEVETNGVDPTEPAGRDSYHNTSSHSLEVAQSCATSQPDITQRGRRSRNAEIRTAFTRHLLQAIK